MRVRFLGGPLDGQVRDVRDGTTELLYVAVLLGPDKVPVDVVYRIGDRRDADGLPIAVSEALAVAGPGP